jgi:hypothetical protein
VASAPNAAQARHSGRSITTNTPMAHSKRRDPTASNKESLGRRSRGGTGGLPDVAGRTAACGSQPAGRTILATPYCCSGVSGRPERHSGVGFSVGDKAGVALRSGAQCLADVLRPEPTLARISHSNQQSQPESVWASAAHGIRQGKRTTTMQARISLSELMFRARLRRLRALEPPRPPLGSSRSRPTCSALPVGSAGRTDGADHHQP